MGLLSTAAIGATVIGACRGSETVHFEAVASRDHAQAAAFADEHGLAHAFASYEELLASDEIDAVYVALPVSMHTAWTVSVSPASGATSSSSWAPGASCASPTPGSG